MVGEYGSGFWGLSVAFADVACSADDGEVFLLVGSAFGVRDDVVYLCAVGCSSVFVVEFGAAVWAVCVSVGLG